MGSKKLLLKNCFYSNYLNDLFSLSNYLNYLCLLSNYLTFLLKILFAFRFSAEGSVFSFSLVLYTSHNKKLKSKRHSKLVKGRAGKWLKDSKIK